VRDGYAAGIDRGRIAATAASCSVALLRRDDMEAARAAWQEDLAKDRRPGRGGSRRRSNPHGGPRVAARLGLALRFDAFGPGPASAQRCDRRATRQRGRPTRSVPGATLESNRARYDRPRRRGGTLRIRESVPARRDQPAAFAMRTVFWDGASRRICPGCSLGERSRRARHAEPFHPTAHACVGGRRSPGGRATGALDVSGLRTGASREPAEANPSLRLRRSPLTRGPTSLLPDIVDSSPPGRHPSTGPAPPKK